MKFSTIADALWGNKSKLSYLLIASIILLFTLLGARDLWTQEHRWADIVWGMIYRGDYLHPYIGEETYYDKPLLSYWLMIIFAKVVGITTWALRLPSAFAGLLTIWSIYRLGTHLKNKELGLLSGWLLLTTFYFVFWARISSADMLNMAGSLFAISWYMDKRNHANFFDYAVFFLVLSVTSLCKGLVGAVVPVIAVLTDMYLQKSWKQHLKPVLFLSLIPALLVYLLPFWASEYFGGADYEESGLYNVFRENIMRYFKPFDHQGPIYTYFIYLPVYLFPWVLLFIPALATVKSRWKGMTISSKWIALSLLFIFAFFTLSGSRRSYYVLPMVPFAILFTADWLLSSSFVLNKKRAWLACSVVAAFLFTFSTLDILASYYYSTFGIGRYATQLQTEVNKIKPWNQWDVVMLDAESKLDFYLRLPPTIKHLDVMGERYEQTAESLLETWPLLKDLPKNTIFISRKRYEPMLVRYFTEYTIIEMPIKNSLLGKKKPDLDAPIAFVPKF